LRLGAATDIYFFLLFLCGFKKSLSLRLTNLIRKTTIEFENEALEELYTSGATKDRQYCRLPKDIVKRFVKVVNYMKAARRLEDLFLIKSLHYEKKKGDLNGIDAVWINDQYCHHSFPRP
jgi:proteic killer suppression protein